MGEYQAIFRLSDVARKRVTPFIEIPEYDYDFERKKKQKTLEAHIGPFARRVEKKWGRGVCFVDANLLEPTGRMAYALGLVFRDLHRHGCAAVPVTGPGRPDNYQAAVHQAIRTGERGVCLRLSLPQVNDRSVQRNLGALMKSLNTKPMDTDCVLDMSAPGNFEPVDVLVDLLFGVLEQLPHLERWRTLTLMGTSFPRTMGSLQRGSQLVPRHEWTTYKKLVDRLTRKKLRIPTFGDYCVAHPDIPDIEWWKMKPAASVRYTTDDAWYVLKGESVRKKGFGQYRDLCQEVASSPHFTRGLSQGDRYIAECALGGATGSLTTWREVATNHHIEKVTRDISNLFAP